MKNSHYYPHSGGILGCHAYVDFQQTNYLLNVTICEKLRCAHKLQTISDAFSHIASRFLKVALAIKFALNWLAGPQCTERLYGSFKVPMEMGRNLEHTTERHQRGLKVPMEMGSMLLLVFTCIFALSANHFGIFARRALVRCRIPMILCPSNVRSGGLHFGTSFVALRALVRELIPNTIHRYHTYPITPYPHTHIHT